MKKVLFFISFLFVSNLLSLDSSTKIDKGIVSDKDYIITSKGTIKKIDFDSNLIYIYHEPIPELKCGSMNKHFSFYSSRLISDLQVNDIVEFQFMKSSAFITGIENEMVTIYKIK